MRKLRITKGQDEARSLERRISTFTMTQRAKLTAQGDESGQLSLNGTVQAIDEDLSPATDEGASTTI